MANKNVAREYRVTKDKEPSIESILKDLGVPEPKQKSKLVGKRSGGGETNGFQSSLRSLRSPSLAKWTKKTR